MVLPRSEGHGRARPPRVLFTDRDGTLNPDFHYLDDADRYDFLPGVIQGLTLAHEAGWAVVCVTNQSGIGRGYFSEERLHAIHARIRERLVRAGTDLDAIYYCPHLPEERCACRKPGTALFERAVEELGLSLPGSAIIGDRALEVQVGRKLGIVSALVPERGLEREVAEELLSAGVEPDLRAQSFRDAVLQILSLG